MAKVLFVRVSVQTYDDKLMQKYWPRLYRLALPKGHDSIKGSKSGVFALTSALRDGVQFALFPAGIVEQMRPFASRLSELEHTLEHVLGEQDVAGAKKCIDAIEGCLDEAEELLR